MSLLDLEQLAAIRARVQCGDVLLCTVELDDIADDTVIQEADDGTAIMLELIGLAEEALSARQ